MTGADLQWWHFAIALAIMLVFVAVFALQSAACQAERDRRIAGNGTVSSLTFTSATCYYSLGHRNRHQCDCVCVRPAGHDGPHQCSAEAVQP